MWRIKERKIIYEDVIYEINCGKLREKEKDYERS